MTDIYDAIVVGAGIEGSATAYQLARSGQNTLLLEQFPIPHGRGSSHGHTRIIRKAYPQDFYTHMMKEAYDEWFQLETDSGVDFFLQCGLLYVGRKDETLIKAVKQSMSNNGLPHHSLSHSDLCRDYPFKYPDTFHGVLDPAGGALLADKALTALLDMFKVHGGTIHDAERVTAIQPGDVIRVTTNKAQYYTHNIVLAAGPWTQKLLDPLGLRLPLEPQRMTVCYWREKEEGSHSADHLPCFISDDGSLHTYGIPAIEYPGHVKICHHEGPVTDPDNRDYSVDVTTIRTLRKFVRERFPGLDSSKPSLIDSCMYTWTPDHNFILDSHPKWRNIIIGAGFSGHGFKLAPVVGRILCDLVLRQSPSYDMSPFKMDRFPAKSSL